MKLNLATELGNVSRASMMTGFSRDTFYRYQSAIEADGVDAPIDTIGKKPNLKNRVGEATENTVVAFRLEQLAFGQVRTSYELRKPGIFLSPSCVRSVWLRCDLGSNKKHMMALERHVAATGDVPRARAYASHSRQEGGVTREHHHTEELNLT